MAELRTGNAVSDATDDNGDADLHSRGLGLLDTGPGKRRLGLRDWKGASLVLMDGKRGIGGMRRKDRRAMPRGDGKRWVMKDGALFLGRGREYSTREDLGHEESDCVVLRDEAERRVSTR